MQSNPLAHRYYQLHQQLESLSDFPVDRIHRSRSLFTFQNEHITPGHFEVWTCLSGLPLPESLTEKFQAMTAQVRSLLPGNIPFYEVNPQTYHWELFIIKRPEEVLSVNHLEQVTHSLQTCLEDFPAFEILYQGLLLTPDGVLLAKGYGDFDELREDLKHQIPFASPKQSQLGHVSLGRILSPVGSKAFHELKQFIGQFTSTPYESYQVHQIKYVHERQWYMEDYDVIAQYSLRG